MGYAVVNMKKIKKGGVGGIQSHNDREKEPRTNPDIDKSKSHLNYEMIDRDGSYKKNINRIIKENADTTKKIREDAVVLCNFIVTSDNETMLGMTEQELNNFFRDSLDFFANRYGRENIVNATVHLDEKTPHLHLGLVPITNGRLSAKALFDKVELKQLQTAFVEQVGTKYGLKRGIEDSGRKHLDELRFKTTTKQAELNEIEHKVKSYEPPKKKPLESQTAYEQRVQTHEQATFNINKEKSLNEWQDELTENQKRLDKGLSSYKIQVNQANEQISQAWNEIERAIEKGVTAELQRQQRLQDATTELNSFKEKLERIGIKERNVFNDNKLHQNERNDTQQSQTQTSRHNAKLHKRHTIER